MENEEILDTTKADEILNEDNSIIQEDNYNLPELTEKEMEALSEDDRSIYKAALEIQANPDFDLFGYWKNNKSMKSMFKDIYNASPDKLEEAKKTLKEVVDIKATNIAMQAEYNRTREKIKAAMPQEFSKAYFHGQDVMFGVIADEEGVTHVPSDEALTNIYLDSLELKDLISLLDDEKAVRKINKNSHNKNRFKRDFARIDRYLKQFYKNENINPQSPVINSKKAVPYLIEGYKVDKFKAIAFYSALSLLTEKWPAVDLHKAAYIYLCHMNAIACSAFDMDTEPYASESKFYYSIKLFFDKYTEQLRK